MVLAGIALNYLFQAMNKLFSYLASDEQREVMIAWGMGSISGLNWNSIMVIAVVSMICLPLLYSKAWDLNLMTVGDEAATSMGVKQAMSASSCWSSQASLLPLLWRFRGHRVYRGWLHPIARLILGSDHRYIIPAAGGLGAVLFLFADAIAMNLFRPTVIPTDTVMSVIGVPFFLYLILRGRRKEYWS